MTVLLSYVSGHGFGHAVRVMEVLRALRARRRDLAIAIRSPLPRWFFDLGLEAPFAHAESRLDVGAVQADSLSLDLEATLRAAAELSVRKEQVIDDELHAVTPLRPSLVFADIPALAFDVAARLQVPGVAMTNFSWDWIYADYVRDLPEYEWVVDDLRRSYGQATALLSLPMHGDLRAFPRIRDIPLVARTARLSRDDARQRLGLSATDRIVLLSFGGMGVTLSAHLAPLPGVKFISTQSAAATSAPRGCRLISNAALAAAGARYEDLVAACDVVMTKPGYGIVSDCIANATPIIYTSRGRFAEYECLVRGIQAHLPNAFMSNEDLHAGRWTQALEEVFAQPRRRPQVDVSGASVAADNLISFLGVA